MQFTELSIPGAYKVTLEPREDERGFFARAFCRDEFQKQALDPTVAQANTSFTKVRGTIRGMHFQKPPFEEQKLVRCTAGSIFDVVIDLRRDSPTFKKWASLELSAENHVMMLVPKGCAHGFQALSGGVEVFYLVSAPYSKEHDSGVRFDDPAFTIRWPLPVTEVSQKDRGFGDFTDRIVFSSP